MKIKLYFSIITLLFCLFFQNASGEPLDSLQATIQKYTLQDQTWALAQLKQLVNINSGTENTQGVLQVGKILSSQLVALGFKSYWTTEPSYMHHAGTLIAERRGSGRKVVLIGHLDTVFPQNSSFQQYNQKGQTATGPGVIDDKGGDIVILMALRALQSVNGLDNTNLTVVLTGDEENSGKPVSISRAPLIQASKGAYAALDFEPASSLNTATVARRGVCHWQITTYGKESHSSQIFKPEIGDGAIFEMARILNLMRINLSTQKYLSFNPGDLLGGTLVEYDSDQSQGSSSGVDNVIARNAIATGDLRFLDENQKAQAKKEIESIVAQHLPGTQARVDFVDAAPGMPPTDTNLNLLHAYSEVSQALGYGRVVAVDVTERGAADISYVAKDTVANLGGLGPTGGGPHTTNEYLDVNSLPIMSARAAMLIYQLTHST